MQPFSLVVQGNTPSQADDFRILTYGHSGPNHVIQWQSLMGVVYLLERSADLQAWETRSAAGAWVNLVGLGSPPALFYVTATAAATTAGLP